MKRQRRMAAMACAVLAMVVTAAFAGSAVLDEEQEKQAIAAILTATIQAGYSGKDVDKIMAAYQTTARIATRIRGELDTKALASITAADLERFDSLTATYSVKTVRFDDQGASVEAVLVVDGVMKEGGGRRREDRVFLRMSKEGGVWKIVRQGYREDFSIAPDDGHGMPGSPPPSSLKVVE